jgi:hypothetical protein
MICDWPFCRKDAEFICAYTTYDGFAALKHYCGPHEWRMEQLRHNPRWTVDKWRILESMSYAWQFALEQEER